MQNLMLVTLSMVCSYPVTVSTIEGGIVISVPEVEGKYGHVKITSEGETLEAIQTDPTTWMVITDKTSGEFKAVICGDGFCRPVCGEWDTDRSLPTKMGVILAMVVGFLVVGLLFFFWKGRS